MGADKKEDCIFCPDHAKQWREVMDRDDAERGTQDCAGSDTKGLMDVTAFIEGTAVPRTHEEFMALAHAAHRAMDRIGELLQQICPFQRDNDTQGG